MVSAIIINDSYKDLDEKNEYSEIFVLSIF